MNQSTRHYLSRASRVAKVIALLLVLCSALASAGQIVSIVITKANSAAQSTLTPGTANLTADGTSTQRLTVTVKDANGNNMTSGGADIAITKSSGTGSISSVTDNGNGTYTAIITSPTAIGSGIFVATLAGEAIKGGTDSQTEATVTYSAGTATKLAITTQPVGGASGAALGTQPVVRIIDANGNTVTTSSASVSVTSTGTLGGTNFTTPVSAVNGIATFTNLTLAGTAGTNYTLSFTNSGLTSATSGNVTVSAGTATQILANSVTTQNTTVGTAVSTLPSVIVKDASNNPVSGVSVKFANGTGGSVSGTMTATTASNGIATFAGTWTLGTTVGSNTLTATSGTLTGSPVTFTATGNASAATKGVLTTQPDGAVNGLALTTQPIVQLQDAQGNNVTTSGVNVVATITTGAGTLSGTTPVATNSSGIAVFTNLSIAGTAGNFVLTFTPTSLTAAASNSFALTTGAASQIAVNAGNNQSATVGTAVSTLPSIIVKDANNNPVSGVSVTFAVATGGGLGTVLSATTDANGIATVGSWTLGTTSGSNTLTATSTGLSGSPVTFTATGIAGTLDHFAISSISSTQTSGTAITGITLTAQDVNNNTVTTFTDTVTYSGTAGITGTSVAFTAGVLSSVSVTPTNSGSGMTFIVTGSSKTGTATFDVTQASSANLTGLALSGSPSGYIFAAGTYSYSSITVPNSQSGITVTPTGTGTITVNGTAVTSGSASVSISLTAGSATTITVVATELGKSAQSYTLTVTRTAIPLVVGNSYGGGIVVYILTSSDSGYDANVQHGLIAATADQSAGIQWAVSGKQATFVSGNAVSTSTAIGTGLANTNAIVTQNGAGSTYAAGLCYNYTVTESGIVYDDWYLPSKDELTVLCKSYYQANKDSFKSNDYWSSTEDVDVGYAVGLYFPNEAKDVSLKSGVLAVRAVRAF
jgi:hypothetical protein